MTLEPNEAMHSKTEMSDVARDALSSAGLSQSEAADKLGVSQPNVSKALNDNSGRYVKLQARLIREIGGWECDGPLWVVRRS